MHHYDFHIGDYIKDTAHLNDAEDLCYRRMLDLYYTIEGPLPLDIKLTARRVRASVDVAEQVLSEFFSISDGGWHHKRCDKELAAIYAKSESARLSAEKRWESKRNADAMRTHTEGNATHYPLPITQESTTLSGKPDDSLPVLANGKQKHLQGAIEVLEFLNLKTGRNYQPKKVNLDLIADRLKEGASVQSCKSIIAKKARDWQGTDMETYLRPATLFNRTKFAQYEGELIVTGEEK